MAIGAAPRGQGSLAWTIQIWPSQELVARSWDWPQTRHEAFDLAVSALAVVAATCILDGRPFGGQDVNSPICGNRLTFSVVRRDDTVFIAITDFSGPESPDPDWPGPNGGASQPKPVDGLVLGLRGSGRYYRMVVFHGFMAPIPATNMRTPLFIDFGYPVLIGKGVRTSFVMRDIASDTVSVGVLLSSMIGSLQIDIENSELVQNPPALSDPQLSPGTIDCGREIGTPEQLKRVISEQQQRCASRALRGHALRLHQREKQLRQGAPPGRYLQ